MLDVLQNRCGLIYTLTVIFCASVFVFRLDFRRARFRRLLFNSSCSGEKEIFVHDIYFSSVFEEEIPGGWSEKYVQEKKLELASGEIIKKINGSDIDMCGQASQYVLLSTGSTACAYEETSISPAKSGFQIAFSLSRVLGMSNVPTTIKRSNSSTVLVQWIVDSRPAEMPSELSSALDSRRTIFSMNESMEVNAWLDIAQWSDICLIGYLSTKIGNRLDVVRSQFDGSLWLVGESAANSTGGQQEPPCLKSLCAFRRKTISKLKTLRGKIRRKEFISEDDQIHFEGSQIGEKVESALKWVDKCNQMAMEEQFLP